MRIKSGVFYWLAVASGAVGMLYALGFAGSIEAIGVISGTTSSPRWCCCCWRCSLPGWATMPQSARLSAASTSTAATPAPKSRSTDRTGGTHERKKARRCWNTGEPAKG